MDYENSSDFEIDCAVTKKVYGCEGWELDQKGRCFISVEEGGIRIQSVLNFCSNPALSEPIISEFKIDLNYEGMIRNEWESSHIRYTSSIGIEVIGLNYCKERLRAAMITFLQME